MQEETYGAGAGTPPPPEASPEPLQGSLELNDSPPATVLAAPSPEPPVTSAAARTDEIVDRWFRTSFPGTVLAQTTEQWNLATQLKDHLKQLLRQ